MIKLSFTSNKFYVCLSPVGVGVARITREGNDETSPELNPPLLATSADFVVMAWTKKNEKI